MQFGFTPEHRLIHDLNLEVRPNEMVAIVGPTGGGKTTLVNLLMRFYELDGGAISIDGQDIAALPRREMRRRIGMALQRTPGSLKAPSRKTSPTAGGTPPGRRS